MKSRTGITLISIVITIIIALILIGVIFTVFGPQGLFAQAREARLQTSIAQAKEKIEVEILAVQAKNGRNSNPAKFKRRTE